MARHVIEIRETTGGVTPKTSRTQPGTRVSSINKIKEEMKREAEVAQKRKEAINKGFTIVAATGLSFNRVNEYVGKYTTNTLAARKRGTGVAIGAMSLYAAANPAVGGVALAGYIADKQVSYGIELSISSVTSDYLSALAGGSYNLNRKSGLGL